MSLEHGPQRAGNHRLAGYACYTVTKFCIAHRISRSKLYQLWRAGVGPRVIRVGTKILVTNEAAADWRRACERQAAAGAE
jgi:hypothetical protein